MSRELMKPRVVAAASRHANGRVTVYLARDELLAVSVPSMLGDPSQLEVTMSPKALLDLFQALTKLIDGDGELRVAAGREDPEAVSYARVNGLEEVDPIRAALQWGGLLAEGAADDYA